MKKIIFIFSGLMLIFSRCDISAFTYAGLPYGIGDILPAVSARAMGMGNTSIAGSIGAEAVFYNPAGIIKITEPQIISSLLLVLAKEVIDSGEDYTNYSSALYFKPAGIAGVYPFKRGFALGLGLYPLHDLGYSHARNIYSSGQKTGSSEYKSKGSINSFILSYGINLSHRLKAGADCSVVFGNTESDVENIEDGATKNTDDFGAAYSGFKYGMGICLEFIEDKASLGIKWNPSFKLSRNWDRKISTRTWTASAWAVNPSGYLEAEGKTEYDYPASVGIGLNYDFSEGKKSSLAIDIERTFWNSLRYREKKYILDPAYSRSADPGFRDTTRISIGVEHRVNYKTLLRYGFTHLPDYSNETNDTTMFTAGAAIPFREHALIEVSGTYGRKTFIGDNVFFEEEETVDESISDIIVSLKWTF
ncbi:OmpP1/FadL family transporter [Elusimicrobiota bacterium]